MVIFALETISGSLGEDGKLYFLFPCSTLYASQFAQVSEWIVSLLDRLGIRTASSKELAENLKVNNALTAFCSRLCHRLHSYLNEGAVAFGAPRKSRFAIEFR